MLLAGCTADAGFSGGERVRIRLMREGDVVVALPLSEGSGLGCMAQVQKQLFQDVKQLQSFLTFLHDHIPEEDWLETI